MAVPTLFSSASSAFGRRILYAYRSHQRNHRHRRRRGRLFLKKGNSRRAQAGNHVSIGLYVVYLGIAGLSSEVQSVVLLLSVVLGTLCGTALHRDVATSSISLTSAHGAKARSFHCGSLSNQSNCFDLKRKNRGADMETADTAAEWSKPDLTTARERGISRALGRFSAAHVAGKTIELDSRHPSREICEASTSD